MNLYKKTENMLYNYKGIKAEIKNILLEIDDIKNNYRGMGAIEYSDMPTAHNNKSTVEMEIEQKESRIEYLKTLLNTKENLIEKIDNALETLTPDEYKIIELRYFNRIPNNRIAEVFGVTEQTTSISKGKIINKMIKLMFF